MIRSAIDCASFAFALALRPVFEIDEGSAGIGRQSAGNDIEASEVNHVRNFGHL